MRLVLELCGLSGPSQVRLAAWGLVLRDPGCDVRTAGVTGKSAGGAGEEAAWLGLEWGLRYLTGPAGMCPEGLLIRSDSPFVLRRLPGGTSRPGGSDPAERCHQMLAHLEQGWRAAWIPPAENAEAYRLAVRAWEAAAGVQFPGWHAHWANGRAVPPGEQAALL